ncbi:unnamed protein product, partial [marine sediment metagenome]
PTFYKFKIASLEELIEIKEIGPKIAESIILFFKEKENLAIIERLRYLIKRIFRQKTLPLLCKQTPLNY